MSTCCYQEILVHYVGQVRVGYEETKKKGYEGEPTWVSKSARNLVGLSRRFGLEVARRVNEFVLI